MASRQFFEELPSTQLHAIELARAGAPSGTYVVARRQTRGRGRADHSWISPVGGLYLSIVAPRPVAKPVLLPLALGERLREHLADAYRVTAFLKWPNDVLAVDRSGALRKLAGTLIDFVDSPGEGPLVVLGVGVNVATDRHAYPPELRDRVAVLAELTDYPPTVDQVEREVLAVIEQTRDLLETATGRHALVTACRRSLYGRGHRARVDGQPVGVIRDLGEEGELWLESAAGRFPLWAGDLTIEEA